MSRTIQKSKSIIRIGLACLLSFSLLGLPVSTQAQETTANESSVAVRQVGLAGDISFLRTIERTEGEPSVIVGTSKGLYHIREGKLVQFLPTAYPILDFATIEDTNDNSEFEFVFSTTSSYFPNIRAYDPETKAKLWDFTPTQEVYSQTLLWTEQQTRTADLTIYPDVDGDDISEIVALSGYKVYLLSGKSGQLLWSYTAPDNIWQAAIVNDQNSDDAGDIVIGGQDGYLRLLSGRDGQLIWENKIIPDYTVTDGRSNRGQVSRSLWDLVPLSDDKLAFSGEDGLIYEVDLVSGQVIWQKEIYSYVDSLLFNYYGDHPNPTGLASTSFFNIRLIRLTDQNADDQADLLAYTFAGSQRGENQYQDQKNIVALLDGKSGEILWQKENLSLSSQTKLEEITVNNEISIPLVGEQASNQQKIVLLDPADGTARTPLSYPAASGSSKVNAFYFAPYNNDGVLVASNSGDLFQLKSDGKVWNFPRITDAVLERIDLTGDDTLDLLVRSRDSTQSWNQLDQGSSRMIYVVDGQTKQVAWSYEMPYDEYLASGGIAGLKVLGDLDQDGKSDLAGYTESEEKSRNEASISKLIVLSGQDGTLLHDGPFTNRQFYNDTITTYINSGRLPSEWYRNLDQYRMSGSIVGLEPFGDRDGDGIEDLFIAGQDSVFILSGRDFHIIWERTYQAWRYEDPQGHKPANIEFSLIKDTEQVLYKKIGDLNQDNIPDLIAFTWDGIVIGESQNDGANLDYLPKTNLAIDNGFDQTSVQLNYDLDKDGVKELTFYRHRENQSPLLEFWSIKEGRKLFELEGDSLIVEDALADFNQDAVNDLFIFERWSETGPKLRIASGANGETLWGYSNYSDTSQLESLGLMDIMPLATIEDLNEDNTPEIALTRAHAWQKGSFIDIYDVQNDELLSTIELESSEENKDSEMRWHPGLMAKLIDDQNNDGHKDLVAVALEGEETKTPALFIVDFIAGNVISSFATSGTQIQKVDDKTLALVGRSGELYLLDTTNSLAINKPQNSEKLSSPLDLAWSQDETNTISQIFVDGVQTYVTPERQASFEIAKGEHTVTLVSMDEFGKRVFANIEVTIEKSSLLFTITGLFLLVLLGLVVGLPLYQWIENKRKPKVTIPPAKEPTQEKLKDKSLTPKP